MKKLPLVTTNAIQINPYLGIILSSNMQGWFLERYINLFMIGSILDYVDNVNYSGTIVCKKVYPYHELVSHSIIDIVINEIDNNHYLNIWVDEYNIPHSFRYKKFHFTHPLIIYGYDMDSHIVKTVYFDILKGQTLVDISFQDMINATTNLDQFYLEGGSEVTVNETIIAFSICPYLKGEFHIDVFAKQLSNYICCEAETNTEWFTSSRAGVYESKERIYGIQIYRQLIAYLNHPALNVSIPYKALHDFVSHKRILLERLKYIQNYYATSSVFIELVDKFYNVYTSLENMRLLNIKKQMQKGRFPASLCRDRDYLNLLIKTLNSCYAAEMDILPQIYDCITMIEYPINHFDCNTIIGLQKRSTNICDNYIEYDVIDNNLYIAKIDIIKKDNDNIEGKFSYLLINKSQKFYFNKHSFVYSPVRTFIFSPMKLTSLRLYTSNTDIDYIVNIYPLPNQLKETTNDNVILNDNWHSFHHVQRINKEKLVLRIIDEDPFIIQENIGVNADEYKYLHVKMSTTVTTIYAQVFFSTVDNPYISMDKSLFFKIKPSEDLQSYYINMSHNSNWQGFVKTLRIDPAQYHDNYVWNGNNQEECVIEMVEFIKHIPDGEEECLIAMSLADDGSTFK